MITTERLAEIELAPREASIFRAEAKELADAYRAHRLTKGSNMKELISRLRTASVVMGNLPEQPGYNGSVLTIDDTEAGEIEKAIDAAAIALEEKEPATTETQKAEFEAITRPVIEWLNANFNPHVIVVIDPTSAVLSEATIAYTTHDYLRD